MEGLSLLPITHTTGPRAQVWMAFRQTHDIRLRERYHGMLLRMDGRRCPDIAQWLYRDDDPMRDWVHAFNHGGLKGLERELMPGRPA
jgi:transposase